MTMVEMVAQAIEDLNEHCHMGLTWADGGSGWVVGRPGAPLEVYVPEAVAIDIAETYRRHGEARGGPADVARALDDLNFVPVEIGYDRRAARFYAAKPVPCGACGSDQLGLDYEHAPNHVRVECCECGACGPWAYFGNNEPPHGEETKAAFSWNKMWAPKPPGPATRGLLMDIAAVARKVRHDSDYVYVGNEWETESRNLADDEIQAALRECGLSESA